ncbi:ABC transporter permease, partial [bacterium]|nr:ABC transporter permease [bacterium]
MRPAPDFLRVARWEFLRFFKAKELLWAVVIIMAVFVGQKAITRKIVADQQAVRTIVVGDAGLAALERRDPGRFRFELSDRSDAELRDQVRDRKYDGLLLAAGVDSARLVVRGQAAWQAELQAVLAQDRRERLVRAGDIDPAFLADLARPFGLQTETLDAGREAGKDAKTSVAILVGLMLLGIFLGNSYLFVAITGEKSQRITEQIMAIISPQSWIDGKILGLALLSLVHVAFNALGYVLYRAVCVVVWGEKLGLPTLLADPLLLAASLSLALAGFYLWFCFFGLVAATISDPNSSSRSTFLFLPFLPLGAAFAGLGNPDAAWIKALALLPFS